MRRISRVQRLARREEKDIVKRIFLLSGISIVLIFILLTVGISALGNLAELLDKVFKSSSEVQEVALTPPILDNSSETTNEEAYMVSGFSSGGEKVEIYLDGEKIGESVLESGKFEYEMQLKSGENEISAKTVSADANSEFSSSIIVTLDTTEPKLEVTNPQDGQSFYSENRVKVEGKTDIDAQVFVNGFLANVNSGGNFETTITLLEGDNEIEIKALDDAGNTTTEEIMVSFRK